MSPLKFAEYVRFKTKTDSNTFTDDEILMLMNIFKDDFAKEIIKVNEDYFGVPETLNLIANQREYPLPPDILNQIKFVEVTFDGTSWIPLKEFDLNSYRRTTDETTITANFSNADGEAAFDIFRGSLWIYSGTIITVTGGLKLWTFQWPADFSDLSSEVDMSIDPTNVSAGFPRAFHELLARRVVIEYKTSSDKPLQLDQFEQKFELDFQKAMDSISNMNLDRAHTITYPPSTQEGNNGFNY